jgi:hypothetical protein
MAERNLFGSIPDLTGDETTDEYMVRIRGSSKDDAQKLRARLESAEAVCQAVGNLRILSLELGLVRIGKNGFDALSATLARWEKTRDE